MPGKHGPNRLGNYLTVHESCMTDLLTEGFVVQDDSRFTILPSHVLLEGFVVCLGGITLEVRKKIAVLDGRGMTATVQTQSYRYHAWIRGAHNIVRYDSPHAHRPYPHKHIYETSGTGREVTIVPLEAEDEVPTMLEVIRELQAWHLEHASLIKYLR